MSGTPEPPTATPTMAARVRDRARRAPDEVAVRSKRRGVWQEVTWARYWRDIQAAAHMLLTLGLAPGDRVAILSENRYEWMLADVATVATGGVTVAIDAAVEPSIAREVVLRTSPSIVIVENQELLDTVLVAADQLPGPAHLVYLDARGIDDRSTRPRLHHWDAAIGEASPDDHAGALGERMGAARPTTIVALLPDLSSTAPARDVVVSAGDAAAAVDRLCADITPAPSERDMVLPFTSLADPDERLFACWLNAAAGVQVHFAEALSTIRQDLRDVQPTIVFAPAHAWERLLSDVDRRLAGASHLKRGMWATWRPLALRTGAARAAGGALPRSVRIRAATGNVLVFRALRARIGMRHVRHAACAGPMPADTLHVLRGIGVPLAPAVGDRFDVRSPWSA